MCLNCIQVIFKSPLIHEGGISNLKREVEIQARLRHPNILRLHGYFYDESSVFLVLEYATQGELFKQLSKQTHFEEPTAAHYVAQVVDALRYCHGCGVYHRDIKVRSSRSMHFNLPCIPFALTICFFFTLFAAGKLAVRK